jgi:predicted nucleotidyltransferase
VVYCLGLAAAQAKAEIHFFAALERGSGTYAGTYLSFRVVHRRPLLYSSFMRRQEAIAALRSYLPELKRDFGVGRIAMFGSMARDEGHEDSDVDLLVHFEVGPTFDSFIGLKLFLEDHLGRRVDLVTPEGLKPRLRPIVEREAVDVA